VGEALGVTRQAAQQRQKGILGRLGDKLGNRGLFARFTDRARTAVVVAQEAARERSHDYIGTEHLLVGLVRPQDGIAVEALRRCGVTREAVEAAVDARVERGTGTPRGHIPFTPRSKKALELALREALDLGHNYLGTEHVLLALAAGDGVATDVLADLGVDHARAKAEVLAVLSERG
jgi:ATP-dependent Clp protease ATP-binding subunit ClpC